MPKVLPIIKLSQKILHWNARDVRRTRPREEILYRQAREVMNVFDPYIQNLIDDMLATMRNAKGVGIAAPQVGVALRVIIVASMPCKLSPQAPFMDPVVLINPTILDVSDRMDTDWEGCLSIPGMVGLVARHWCVHVRFLNRWGHIQFETYKGFPARILQHEDHHLNGVLYKDRLARGSVASRSLITKSEFEGLSASPLQVA